MKIFAPALLFGSLLACLGLHLTVGHHPIHETALEGFGRREAGVHEDHLHGTGEADAIPVVGGAMDLASGAREVWVMMDLLDKQGRSKIVRQCTYPLTGVGCVRRIYTDLATFYCTSDGLYLKDAVPGLTLPDLEALLVFPFLN